MVLPLAPGVSEMGIFKCHGELRHDMRQSIQE